MTSVLLKEKLKEERLKMTIDQIIKVGFRFKGYNINEAVKYALKYALEINPKFWNYEQWGGDCTNYVSQCLYAGGIPFDTAGIDVRYHWYWYNDTNRTPSWTAADSLKFYMENNNVDQDGSPSLGLKAIQVGLEQLLRGDLVQLLDHRNKAYHSMIVTGYLVQGEKVVDYLVSQHSGYDPDDEGRLKNFRLSQKEGKKLAWSIMGYVVE